MDNYEKLGAFYLGRGYDASAREATNETFLYDSKDLCTHAVCVGMTGSGKTGLCVTLLEEAAIDGIPAIVIDPKGDLTNLLLTFPSLDAASFRPWVNEDAARQKGVTPDAFAAQQAKLWHDGLATWEQDGSRIQRLKDAAEFTIFTPGSSAGAQVSVLSSLQAPPAEVIAETDLLAEQCGAVVSSLLALLGIDADPIKSKEHIFLTSLLQHEWSEGRDLDIAAIIQRIQSPPFSRVGVLELESFYPAKERFELAMQLNNLLASPRFQAWMEGEPLDVGSLLYTDTGKPRVSIFSIAHLDEAERMFFVSLLLNQTLAWMRTRAGTSSLRAIIYMDEIFGYLPPVANPPSKRPLLTMLKQARAFGVGLVLSTQNPVDLDYKALSNAGTWFIGRLQTERDRDRLLDGLSSASGGVDIGAMEDTISSLDKRVFVAHNVHEERPSLFHTRWAMSYLVGPLTRKQIRTLAGTTTSTAPRAAKTGAPSATPSVTPSVTPRATPPSSQSATRPVLAPDIPQSFLDAGPGVHSGTIRYQPAVLGVANVHLTNRGAAKPHLRPVAYIAPIHDDVPEPDWADARETKIAAVNLKAQPVPGASFDTLPAAATDARSYKRWEKEFADALYRNERLELFSSRRFKLTSEPGESERDFRVRIGDIAREIRDEQVGKLRKKFESKFSQLDERIRRAEQTVGREEDDARGAKMQTAVSLGATLLSAFLGRKAVSSSTMGKATTTLRGVGRSGRYKRDVERAKETLEALHEKREELARRFEGDVEDLEDRFDPQLEELESSVMKPRRTDIDIKKFTLLWVPPGAFGA